MLSDDEIIKEYHDLGLETIMSERLYLEWRRICLITQ